MLCIFQLAVVVVSILSESFKFEECQLVGVSTPELYTVVGCCCLLELLLFFF